MPCWSGYQEIIRRVKEDGDTRAGTYSYKDEKGVAQLVVYKYLKDRDWVFMVRDNEAEVYGAVAKVRVVVGMLCTAVTAAVIFVTLLILYKVGKELMVVEGAIRNLGNLDLSADRELKDFYGRTDEIGMIAQTTHHMCDCLRKTIDDIGRILGEMAKGNIAVDVVKNETYYIGDFKVLAESLKIIRTNLMNVMRDISSIANQVDTGADQVSTGVETLSRGTMEQSVSIEGLASNVTEITSKIKDSAVRCSSASELVDKANGYAAEADTKMEQLTTATRNIDQSSTQIGSIIKTIEEIAFQTNVLALNASVEAAQNTSVLIGRSIQDIKVGTESTDHVISAMQVINECIESIKMLMDEIASASVQQSEMITSVEKGLPYKAQPCSVLKRVGILAQGYSIENTESVC